MRGSAGFSLSLSMMSNDLHGLRHYFFMRNCPAVNDILFCIQISSYGLFNIVKAVLSGVHCNILRPATEGAKRRQLRCYKVRYRPAIFAMSQRAAAVVV